RGHPAGAAGRFAAEGRPTSRVPGDTELLRTVVERLGGEVRVVAIQGDDTGAIAKPVGEVGFDKGELGAVGAELPVAGELGADVAKLLAAAVHGRAVPIDHHGHEAALRVVANQVHPEDAFVAANLGFVRTVDANLVDGDDSELAIRVVVPGEHHR